MSPFNNTITAPRAARTLDDWAFSPMVRAIGIPVLALLASILGRTPTCPWWMDYVISLAYTAFFWQGCAMLLLSGRRRYPSLDQTGRRVRFMLLYGALGLLIGNAVMQLIVGTLLQKTAQDYFDHYTIGLALSTIICIMACSVFEALYFFGQWQLSHELAKKLSEQSLNTQLTALRNQINPHFLFNNLNTLAAVIEEDPLQGSRMVQELARFYRFVLRAEVQTYSTVAEDMECLQAYWFLLQMRHGEQVSLELEIPPSIMEEAMAPMALQMLVENAVKHNAATRATPLQVRIYADNDCLVVENNLSPRMSPLPGTGTGLTNLRERYRLLGLGNLRVLPSLAMFRVCLPLASVHKQPALMNNWLINNE